MSRSWITLSILLTTCFGIVVFSALYSRAKPENSTARSPKTNNEAILVQKNKKNTEPVPSEKRHFVDCFTNVVFADFLLGGQLELASASQHHNQFRNALPAFRKLAADQNLLSQKEIETIFRDPKTFLGTQGLQQGHNDLVRDFSPNSPSYRRAEACIEKYAVR